MTQQEMLAVTAYCIASGNGTDGVGDAPIPVTQRQAVEFMRLAARHVFVGIENGAFDK